MEKNGIHTEYYENGEKKFEGTFKNGKKEGLFTWWYENGQKEYEGLYEDGRKISVEEWNEDGSVKKLLNETPLGQIKENKMKFRRLLSYKLDNDSILEYSTTVKGMGRVQINGETVSEKIGIRTEIHSFNYNNSSYVLSLSPLFSLYTLGYRFELIRDDVQLFLCGEKKTNDSKAIIGSIVLGFLIVAIIYIAYKLLT